MGPEAGIETEQVLAVTRSVAREVADFLRTVARAPVGRDEKLDRHDIVTEHDRRAEEIATTALRKALPACRIVGEEHGVQEGAASIDDAGVGAEAAALAGAGLTFYIDPIDGTSNFVAGMPTFAVSIGATMETAKGPRLVAGVVNAPLLGHEFYAGAGMGAWVESFDTDGPVRLGTPAERAAAECLVLSTFPGGSAARQWGMEALEIPLRLKSEVMAVRGFGTTAIELAFVAAGWADGTYGTHAGPWDLAAGFLLVTEAGGTLSHAPLLGAVGGENIWEIAGYAASGPGRELGVLHRTLADLEVAAASRRA